MSETLDHIELTYKIPGLKGKSIFIILNKRKFDGEIDYIEEITRLKERIDELETKELIHVHDYPMWETYEDFTKLPGHKYIEAGLQPKDKYYKKRETHYFLGEYKNINYRIIKIEEQRETNYLPNFDMRCDRQFNCNVSKDYLWQFTWNENFNIEDRYFESFNGTKSNGEKYWINCINPDVNQRKCFDRSVKVIRTDGIPYIHQAVIWYINTYINGWILLNHAEVKLRSLHIVISLLGNKISINISLSKKPEMIVDSNNLCANGKYLFVSVPVYMSFSYDL